MVRKKSRPYTVDDVRYVFEHYAEMTAAQIAQERGISKFQVSKIVTDLRKQGVTLPKKKRENPVEAYVRELGLKPKNAPKTKTRRPRKKKTA